MMKISKEKIKMMMGWIRYVIFPEYTEQPAEEQGENTIGRMLMEQVGEFPEIADADKVVEDFMLSMPEISRLLWTDVRAVMHNDPAVKSIAEVVICYPLVTVMLHYRVAHRLYELGVPVIPRVITEIAHSETGVDIHPAARIGEYFGIDHGTGIVIGETTIIGSHVMLYQGVTLGAKNFHYDEDGQPLDLPRHPIIEDNVTIYSNASVLGRIRIGHDSTIGGNVWLTHNVAPYSRVVQGRTIEVKSNK